MEILMKSVGFRVQSPNDGEIETGEKKWNDQGHKIDGKIAD